MGYQTSPNSATQTGNIALSMIRCVQYRLKEILPKNRSGRLPSTASTIGDELLQPKTRMAAPNPSMMTCIHVSVILSKAVPTVPEIHVAMIEWA